MESIAISEQHSAVGRSLSLDQPSGFRFQTSLEKRLKALSSCHWKRRSSDNTSVFSALEMFYHNALYKLTFYLITYLSWTVSGPGTTAWKCLHYWMCVCVRNNMGVSELPYSMHGGSDNWNPSITTGCRQLPPVSQWSANITGIWLRHCRTSDSIRSVYANIHA